MIYIPDGWRIALGLLATFITIAALVPYVRSVLTGTTRPHVITWLIWAISTMTVFAAQWLDGGGAGAWSTGVAGLMTCGVVVLAWCYRADLRITRSDLLCLALAVLAIPLWWFSSDALIAVIILTAIDGVAYAPTFRKSYYKPHQEQCLMYNVMSVRNVLSIIALEHVSWVTVLFPAVTTLLNVVLVSMIMVRRKQLYR